jgi:hypothetical protein
MFASSTTHPSIRKLKKEYTMSKKTLLGIATATVVVLAIASNGAEAAIKLPSPVICNVIPWQQFVNSVDLMICDTAENIIEPNLWIDAVELGGLNQLSFSLSAPQLPAPA